MSGIGLERVIPYMGAMRKSQGVCEKKEIGEKKFVSTDFLRVYSGSQGE